MMSPSKGPSSWWSGLRPTMDRGCRRFWLPAIGCLRSIRCRWPDIGSGIAFREPRVRVIRSTPTRLAELVRLDRDHHRQLAVDSRLAEQVKVLTRAHQSLIWARQRQVNVLRSALREFYPAALAAFSDLAGRDALAVLPLAPSPDAAKRLTVGRVQTALRRAGRQRNIASRATEILTALQSDQLQARLGVAEAYGAVVQALLRVIGELVDQSLVLQEQVEADFGQHPDADIYLSQPGLGPVLAARVLAEFGDAPDRYDDARRGRIRWHQPDHSSIRRVTQRAGPTCSQPATGRCSLPAGFRCPQGLSGGAQLLRRPSSAWRDPPSGAARCWQSPRWHPSRLSTPPSPL